MPMMGTSGTSGVLKGRGKFRVRAAHHQDAGAHQHEGEQSSDAGHLTHNLDGRESGEQD